MFNSQFRNLLGKRLPHLLKLTLAVAMLLVIVAAVGQNSAEASSAEWRAVYWNNDRLEGTPVLVRTESSLNNNWGLGSPAPEVNSDYFSARWTTTVSLSAGTYRFTATSDDGMMVWVDGKQIINEWYEHPPRTVSAEIQLAQGSHEIRVDYFELRERAVASVNWAPASQPPAQPQPPMQPPTQPQPPMQPPTQPPTGLTARVYRVSVLNVRAIPGDFSSPIVGRVVLGEYVPLTGFRTADSQYIQIVVPTGAIGWVNGYYLNANFPFSDLKVWQQQPDGGIPAKPPMGQMAGVIVNVDVLNVREVPGDLNSPVVGKVTRGQIVELTGFKTSSTRYYQLRLPSGAVGWVNNYYIETDAPTYNFGIYPGY
jgi:uncharacterized protein YgiM (DUF1202 family)